MKLGRSFLFGWVLPILTGILYALALPPFDQGELGWVALIPLLFAIEDCPRGEAFRRGYIAGLVFFGMTIWWLFHVTLAGMVALVAFLALYFGAAGLFLNLFGKNEKDAVWYNLLVAFVGAAGWVTLEWLRGHLLLGGFGWNGLGITQHVATPLVQFASYTGAYGVSALVFILNYGFFCTARRFIRNIGNAAPLRRLSWEFYIAMLLACGAFLHGLKERPAPTTRSLNLALIQGNIPQSLKFDEREKPMILDRYRTLTETAAWANVDLIIWPETATPGALRYDPESFALATNAAIRANAYLLTGTVDITPHSDPLEAFNAAILVRPDGSLSSIYRKIHLVAFGEYVPLRKIFPFIKWLTPITDSFERGHAFTLASVHGLQFGSVICFEDTVPDLYREFVKVGADFMVNLTNDAWFKDSPAAEMHLANAVFRAVETRRWLVRCTNNGITCAVDPTGVVRARTPPFLPATSWLTLSLPAELPVTFYTQHGDVFVGGCAVLAGIAVFWQATAHRRSRVNSQPTLES